MTGKGCENYQFGMTVSPLDCMGCGVCVDVCPAPGKALKMMPQESQLAQQEVFDYAVANVGKKERHDGRDDRQGFSVQPAAA